MRSAIYLVAIGALVASSACGHSPTGPSISAPMTPVTSVPESPEPVNVTGSIIVRSVTPASGSTVRVRDCGTSGQMRDGSRPAHFLNICSDEPGVTVEVAVDHDISDAIVTVEFADGDRTCGRAKTEPFTLTGGRSAVVTTSRFNMYTTTPYLEMEYVSCGMPASTTQMIVGLRRASNPALLLPPEELAHQVTFTLQ